MLSPEQPSQQQGAKIETTKAGFADKWFVREGVTALSPPALLRRPSFLSNPCRHAFLNRWHWASPRPGLPSFREKPAKTGCEKFGTRIAFLPNPPDAFKKAREENKQVFFLHLSGIFEDKEFT